MNSRQKTVWPILGLAFALSFVAQAALGAISISGSQLVRDGRPWIPRGVVLVGRVAPAAVTRGKYAEARAQFGDRELKDIDRFGADLVRFQVSQGGVDPQSDIYSAAYLDEVVQAVRLARAHGFAVIVCLQSEKPSGENDPNGLPTDSSRRAWAQLAPRFASDTDVMLELFNEPSRPRGSGKGGSNPTWVEWRAAMQSVLDVVRQARARNVVIADGLDWSHRLDGVPLLSDPEGKVVYAVHPSPRLHRYQNGRDWDQAFGDFARNHPVLVTAWNARNGRICLESMPTIAADFLSYARAHRLGVVGWSYDFPGALRNADGTLSSYDKFSCNSPNSFGAGQLLHNYFTH